MEISFEAWEGVQRHGQDLADRLAQGFTGLLHAPPQFPWPPAAHKRMPFEIDLPVVPFVAHRGAAGPKEFPFPAAAVSSVIDIGGRLGQAGVEIGASVGGAVQHVVKQLPLPAPFRKGQIRRPKLPPQQAPPPSPAASVGESAVGLFVERAAVDRCPLEAAAAAAAAATGSAAASSVSGVAGGDDLDEDDEGFGCEIGTFGNYKKSKITDLHDLNNISEGWGLYYLFETPHFFCRFISQSNTCFEWSSFPLSRYMVKASEVVDDVDDNKHGTRFTPMFQWPDKSVSLGVTQPLAWKRSGLMVRPSIQVSVCPTFGGNDPGVRAEVAHSLKEELNLMCGLSCSRHPSAFTALAIGRSKWNGQVGSSGVVITLETPLNNIGRPSLSVQLNGGFEL
ncbi:hypothetical protein PR202_gb04881 [Eleusine coracana subsp. coracana]|uniref:Uncharacterized protein n=1 Tax=Eleusine coracana subsp. coracana TaxID=191504 RepID=A0AAV5E5P0_ELECO|nr:hypothetical protein PR202_gb04881 [Eleusine coracana subsp. coracana]